MATADVRTLLSEADVDRLRAGFNAEAMNAGARGATEVPFPPATPLVEALLAGFYQEGALLPPASREIALCAVMAAQPLGGPRSLAMHFYWALAVGVPLADLAALLLLVGAYAGIDRYTASIGLLSSLCSDVLRPALASSSEPPTSAAIAGAIGKRY